MLKCRNCGDGIVDGSATGLCSVCYWMDRASQAEAALRGLLAEIPYQIEHQWSAGLEARCHIARTVLAAREVVKRG